MTKALELLAPAKNLECGMAAIDHGADAVYIGAPHFGARASAGNSVADIAQLCTYAHQFQAKVYVTVNTIIYDNELEDARRLLAELAEAKVDAVLVQDMALLKLCPPSLHLHASTQTDNRTPEKVRWLSSLGFRRVVLARELSVDEIQAIHKAVPDVELEVFVHGALCVSYSGLCYASQHCFRRSANRGECAQFCRMQFDLLDADGRELEHNRHLLSLKDMNQIAHLEQLIEAGATSFKIEGRLKDVAYVKNVTAAYSERLNEIVRRHPDCYRRSSSGRCTYTFTPDLRKTFNRGYTDYFYNGRQPDIASFDTPKAMGEFVGTVKELRTDSFNVAGVNSFANGDGLCFVNDERQLEGFRANRVVGNRIYPYRMPRTLRAGMRLYRNSDQAFEHLLAKPSAERRMPIKMRLEALPDGFALSVADETGLRGTFLFNAEHQPANTPQRENIVRQLTKLGNTPFVCEDVDIPADFNYFIPSSRLAEWRRYTVSQLLEASSNQTPSAPAQQAADALWKGYDTPYLYNISNHLSRDFYGADALTAYELQAGKGPLMQCRYCLRYSLGYCVRRGGKHPTWREPLYLRLGDGRRFRLEFDCRHCQMNVYAPDC